MGRGKKPFKTSLKKEFSVSSTLVRHQRIQVGMSLYEMPELKKGCGQNSQG